MCHAERRFIDVPSYKIVLYRLAKLAIIAYGTYVYYTCYNFSPVFGFVMVVLFVIAFSAIADRIVNFISYLFHKPLVLKEDEDIVQNGIPSGRNVVFFHPIFAGSIPEMEALFNSLSKEIINNREPNRNIKFIIIDNTRSKEVREYTRSKMKDFHKEFGEDIVYYFHRNHACDFFKKAGIYQDSIMLLYEGWTRPHHYIDKKWDPWTQGTRNPDEAVFDEIIGDVHALGLECEVDDILKGKDISVNKDKRPEISIVCDADNVWPKGQVRKLVAKILHPENKDIVIFQPLVEISNTDENLYVKLSVWGRDMVKFDILGKWRLYHFSPFYGKGAMRIGSYIRDVIKQEVLHPGKAASHDFQESLYAWTAYLEDVWVLEKSFPNKLAGLLRGALWQWGDLETVKQYLFKKTTPGRKAHIRTLLYMLIREPVFFLWLTGTVVSFNVRGLVTVPRPDVLAGLFAGILFCYISISKFFTPLVNTFNYRKFHVGGSSRLDKSLLTIIWQGIIHAIVSNLINRLELIYKTKASLYNCIKQTLGEKYVWKTGAMGELETANMSLFQVYRRLPVSIVLGVGLMVLGYYGVLSGYTMLFLSPFIASFILGPAVIWFTAKSR